MKIFRALFIYNKKIADAYSHLHMPHVVSISFTGPYKRKTNGIQLYLTNRLTTNAITFFFEKTTFRFRSYNYLVNKVSLSVICFSIICKTARFYPFILFVCLFVCVEV